MRPTVSFICAIIEIRKRADSLQVTFRNSFFIPKVFGFSFDHSYSSKIIYIVAAIDATIALSSHIFFNDMDTVAKRTTTIKKALDDSQSIRFHL